MRMIRLRTNVSLNAVCTYIALFCVATFALIEDVSTTLPFVSGIKMPLMYVGGIALLLQIKPISRVLLKKKYFSMLLQLSLFLMAVVFSMLVNWNTSIGEQPLTKTVRLLLFLTELYLVMILLAETGRADATLTFLFWYILLLVVVNDFLMFTRFLVYGGRHELYVLGTKFSVSYRHLELLVLWAIRNKRRNNKLRFSKIKAVLITAFTMVVAVRVGCITGIIGGIALLILFTMIDSPRRNRLLRFTSPVMLGLALAASVVLAFAADAIMQIPVVKYVVEDVLGRNATITGRTIVYENYIERIGSQWLAGYGYGNGGDASNALFKLANAQNGLLHWVLQVGVIATSALVMLLLRTFRQIQPRNPKNMEKILPLVALVYVYIILSTVEISLHMAFLMWFAVLFMLTNEKKKVLVAVPAETDYIMAERKR